MDQKHAVITLDDKYIGTQTDITFSFQTDIVPQYSINTIDPEGFSEGISMVSGTINLALIDSTVLQELNPNNEKLRYGFVEEIDRLNYDAGYEEIIDSALSELTEIKFIDELPPFTLNIFNIDKKDGKPIVTQMTIKDAEFISYRIRVNVNDVIALESIQFIGLDYISKLYKE